MGELFRRNRPSNSLAWTGERLVSSVGGLIENEHLHRYLLARDLCRHKQILDVASGEGYGTALLAQTAEDAVGVEIDPASVEHASRSYSLPNLRYLTGSATALPLESRSVDVVVSFETLEHFSDHESFLSEVKRVLRPDGLLVISTPDMDVYSGPGSEANPFHVRELSKRDFFQLLEGSFPNVALLRQRALVGSVIVPERPDCRPGTVRMFEQRDLCTFEAHPDLPRAPYLLAIASQDVLPPVGLSVYLQADDATGEAATAKSELQRLRKLEEDTREQAPVIARQLADAKTAQKELRRLQELEARIREQAPIIAARLADAEAAHVAVQRLSSGLPRLEKEAAGVAAAGAQISETQERLIAAQNQAAAARAETITLNATLLEVRANEANLRDRVKNLQEEIDLSRQSNRERAQQLATLDQSIAEISSDRDQARQQFESANLLLRQQTLTVLRAEKEVTVQMRRAQLLSAEMEQCRSSKEARVAEVQTLRAALAVELEAVKKNLAESERDRLRIASQVEQAIQAREHVREVLTKELEASRQTAERYQLLSKDLASLVVPVWLRKLIPTSIRPIARAMKGSKGSSSPDA